MFLNLHFLYNFQKRYNWRQDSGEPGPQTKEKRKMQQSYYDNKTDRIFWLYHYIEH